MHSPESSGPLYLGIDLGGTNIKAGVVTADGDSLARISLPTQADQGPERGIENLVQAGRQAITAAGVTGDDIRAVGLATPGTMDIPEGMLLDPPNLAGWENVPIRQQVADRLGLPTVLQNDANAAAYGEFWVGTGRDAHSLVLWTLGTGIGCGIIIGDAIIEGEHSHGSECGHIIIAMDNGRKCDTGQYGTLEAYASAKSLVRRCREALVAGRDSALRARVDRNTKANTQNADSITRLVGLRAPMQALVRSFKQTPGAPFTTWRMWMVSTFRKQGLYRKRMFG